MTIFYFTGTGNSLAVAKRIGGNLISIPKIIGSVNQKYEDNIIGFVFPIYALAAPKMVRQFLEKVQFKADYTFAIGTYGNSTGSAMKDIQKLAKKNGNSFDYTDSVKMVDNCLPIFDIGKEIENIPKKKTEEKIILIKENIENKISKQEKSSIAMQMFSAIISGLLKYEKSAKKYIVNKQCNKCGICMQVCIGKNIKIQDNNIYFNENCAGCQACIHLCPQNAIHLKNEKNNIRWINPDVTINEIILANN